MFTAVLHNKRQREMQFLTNALEKVLNNLVDDSTEEETLCAVNSECCVLSENEIQALKKFIAEGPLKDASSHNLDESFWLITFLMSQEKLAEMFQQCFPTIDFVEHLKERKTADIKRLTKILNNCVNGLEDHPTKTNTCQLFSKKYEQCSDDYVITQREWYLFLNFLRRLPCEKTSKVFNPCPREHQDASDVDLHSWAVEFPVSQEELVKMFDEHFSAHRSNVVYVPSELLRR